MSEEKLYAERNAMELDRDGGHYCKHVRAMTAEGLHSKSDIAAELAHRDLIIDQLANMLEKKLDLIKCGIGANYSGDPYENERYTEAKDLLQQVLR